MSISLNPDALKPARPHTVQFFWTVVFGYSFLSFSSQLPAASPASARAAIVSAQVQNITPNPENPADSQVSVKLEVQASAQPITIPACGPKSDPDPSPWIAHLASVDKTILKPAFGAVQGVSAPENCNPVLISPNERVSFRFVFSTRLFGLNNARQRLRLAIGAWKNSSSWQDGRPQETLWSPVFVLPAR